MRKKVTFMIFVTVMFLFVVRIGSAQELGNKVAVGARGAFYKIADDDIPLGEIKSNGTAYGEANITYFFVNWFSLELSGGYVKPDLDLNRSSTGGVVEYGEIEQIPILLTAHFHWWKEIPLVGLYAGAGVGYFINDFEVSSSFRSVYPNVVVDADDSFGFHIVAGLEYFLTKKLSLNLDFKYIYNPVDFVQRQPGVADLSFDLDLHTFYGGAGIKYYF